MKKYLKSLRVACRNASMQDEFNRIVENTSAPDGVEVQWGFRRIPLSRGRHHGGYVCAFRGQPLVRVESNLERTVVKALAADPACALVATQPLSLWWRWKGVRRRYTPDILVAFDAVPDAWKTMGLERLSLVEVKPPRVEIASDLEAEHARVIHAALGMPLVRLPRLKEAQS